MWFSALSLLTPAVLIESAVGYDFVVVGGGTGGLTLASRLTEDPTIDVLVLEAGPNAEHLPEVFVPGLVGSGQAYTTLNWAYNTTPQDNLNGRVTTVNAGKALGGSTVINSMIFSRGQKNQYDTWGILNNSTSWTWDALLPFFKHTEIFTPPNEFQSANGASFLPRFHGFSSEGRVPVGFPNFFFPQAELWGQTAVDLGFAATPDLTSGEVEAVGVSPNSLDAANNTRPNFTVITNATVSRIIWSSKNEKNNLVASGVEYYLPDDTEPHIVNVSREVIVSAGTVGSPKVLELSGVGNATILKAAGVEPVLDHPTVGENFADHLHSWVNGLTNASLTADVFFENPELAQQQLEVWFKNRTGVYSSASGKTLAITPPSKLFTSSELDNLISQAHANLSRFAAQLSNGNPNLAEGIKAQHKLALKLYLNDKAGPLEMNLNPGYAGPTPQEQRLGQNFTAITVSLYAPLSRGRVHIASSDICVPPLVNPAYWSHPLDVAAHVAGIKLARKMLTSPPLSSTNLGEFEPGSEIQTDKEIEEWLRDVAEGDNHPVGTMSMLPKELGGVVDTSLKIYGTENVRVVDASIIPFPISAHISSTVYMIGEKVFVPGLIGTGQSYTTLNWAYNTTPQENMNNRIMNVKAGKALGGSTVINSMIFSRGQKDQYDAWGTLNDDSSWTWDALLPYFKRSEIFTPPNEFQAANGAQFLPHFHGFNSEKGRVHVGFPNFFFPQAELWAQTAVEMGFAATPDLTDGEVEAVGLPPNSLDAASNTRPNFTVITNATASRIIWSTKDGSVNLVASGVEFYLPGDTEPRIVNASREVIVSAGTVGSPKILELSGVGNASILRAVGVEPIFEHPTVGENFADIFSQNPDLAQQQLDLWFENRTGVYSAASGRTLGIIAPLKIFSSSELDTLVAAAHANLSHFASQFSNGNPTLAKGIEAQHKLALKLYLDDKAGPLEMNLSPGYGGPTLQEQRLGKNFTTITVVLYAPLSRGRIHIASSDPRIPPFVDPAYWSHPLDVTANVAGIKLARRMMANHPLNSINLGEFEPGNHIQSDEEIEGWLKDIAGGDNHPLGTMAMLPRELGGVVDTSLKIYGTENVRVADASIIPFPISAHISSTVYMIGEKAAQIVKDSRNG
ncbi:hypothetical protein V5O48_010916 [Marasmius crinis-equi]|uniref:Glucose-methanol-choline oxidoreductase N-terminal domain-containing protein n=1 Tax=Marasmius crinis-equi TaxID=585013 RepID=A0ABR3F721_9AGAR